MIIRLIVVDPEPRDPKDDTIVYQVPEGSRGYELLTALLDDRGLDWVKVESTRKGGRKLTTKIK